MTGKQIGKWTLIVTVISALSAWAIWGLSKNSNRNSTQSIGDITSGNGSLITVNQQIFNISNIDADKAQELEARLKNLTPYQQPFDDRPKIVVVEPYVRFVNFQDIPGLVKAGINVPLLNIGGVRAKNVVTKWKIYDAGRSITSASDYLGYDPYIINELLPGTAINLYYNPDIGASGIGTFRLVLELEYINVNTGEKYAEQYDGVTDYLTQRDNKPIMRVLTRQ